MSTAPKTVQVSGDSATTSDASGIVWSAWPPTQTEMTVAAIWKEVLHLFKVSLQDDFQALGGDSLGATLVASRINELFSIDLPPREIFGTIEETAAIIEMAVLAKG